ncbi:MAG: hypothetical protein ACOVOR_05520 [Rhabdochlamydiaceae bacterium]
MMTPIKNNSDIVKSSGNTQPSDSLELKISLLILSSTLIGIFIFQQEIKIIIDRISVIPRKELLKTTAILSSVALGIIFYKSRKTGDSSSLGNHLQNPTPKNRESKEKHPPTTGSPERISRETNIHSPLTSNLNDAFKESTNSPTITPGGPPSSDSHIVKPSNEHKEEFKLPPLIDLHVTPSVPKQTDQVKSSTPLSQENQTTILIPNNEIIDSHSKKLSPEPTTKVDSQNFSNDSDERNMLQNTVSFILDPDQTDPTHANDSLINSEENILSPLGQLATDSPFLSPKNYWETSPSSTQQKENPY